MVKIDLQDLGGTLGMGVFSLLLLVYGIYLFQLLINDKKAVTLGFHEWFKNWPIDFNNIAVLSLIVISVFGLGTLIEDITDHFSDDDYSLSPPFLALAKEYETREAALIHKKDTSLSSLGREVFTIQDLESLKKTKPTSLQIEGKKIEVSEYWEASKVHLFKTKNLKKHINRFYYRAKNWCYSQSNYYIELQKIQNRIDFTRSIYYTCWIGLLSGLFFGLLTIIKILFITQKPIREIKIEKGLLTYLGILLLIISISRLGYKFSELNFNKRAFGYYVSHWQEMERVATFKKNHHPINGATTNPKRANELEVPGKAIETPSQQNKQ